MKKTFSIYIFLAFLILGLFSCTEELVYNPVSNDDKSSTVVDGDSKTASITITNAGTLKQSLSSADAMELTSLTIVGPVNGTDLKYIRELAGSDNVGKETLGKLTKLDLSAAQLVKGGEAPFIYEGTPCEMTSDNAVPSYGFGYCKLKEILLPDNITSFGSQAFYSCANLETINIPSALQEVSISVFCNCTALSSPITIPEKITAISDYMFYNCGALTQVTLPKTIRSIGYASFYKCGKLTDLGNDLENLETIDKFSFAECKNLQKIYLAKNMTFIPEAAYANCSQAKGTVDLSAIKEVRESAFKNCSMLTSVIMGEVLETIGKSAFRQAGGFAGRLVLPRSLKFIGNGAFYSTGITDLEIHSDITTDAEVSIESHFGRCRSLKSLIVTEGCTMLDLSFSGCTALNSVSLPQSLTLLGYKDELSFGGYVFSNCSSLTSINLPSQLIIIGSGTFKGTGLSEIVIPESVEKIGAYALATCANLTNVKLPSNLKIVSQGLFENCTSLTTLQLPATITEIEYEAFSGSAIASLTLPDGVTTIGKQAFNKCANLSAIHVPASLKTIGDDAFFGCTSLSQLTFDPASQLGKIGNSSFYQCSSLKEVILPSGLSSIGQFAFSMSGLITLSIPASVTDYGDECFARCMRLSVVNNYSQTPQPISTNVFFNVQLGNAKLFVPASSINLYKSSAIWNQFGTITSLEN